MGSQVHFYAARQDLLPVLLAIESKVPLQYVKQEDYLTQSPTAFMSASELPSLGVCEDDRPLGASYLLCPLDIPVQMRWIGGVRPRYVVDQLFNPDTACLDVGGLCTEGTVLRGRIAIQYATAFPQAMIKTARRAISKHFEKIKGWRVGPVAAAMLDRGARLTYGMQASPMYDVRR